MSVSPFTEEIVKSAFSNRSFSGRTHRFLGNLLSHNGSIAIVDQAVVSATNFATGLAVARVGGKAELGLYMLAWTLLIIANDVFSAIITTPYNIIRPTLDAERQQRYGGSVLLQQLVLSALCALMLIVGGGRLGHFGASVQIGRLMTVFASLFVVLVFREFARRMYFAHLEMGQALINDTVACALQLSLVGLLIARGALTAVTAYLAIALAALIPGVAWLWGNRHQLKINTSASFVDFRRNWRLAKWIVGSGVLWAAAMYMYPWLLAWMHGTSATGVWAACYGLVALSNPVLMGFGNYLGPKIALLQGYEGVNAMRGYVYRSSGIFAALLAPIFLIVWIWGDDLVRHLYGPVFAGNEVAIRILAVNVLVAGAVFPFSRGFFTLHRAAIDLAVNVLAIAILFTFGIWLVSAYGVVGAAIGLVMTSSITAVVRAAVFSRVALQRHSPEMDTGRVAITEAF